MIAADSSKNNLAMYIERSIFVNRAPFNHIDIEFKRFGINVLSAINGKGKTTILSHIVDALYEMARPAFANSFEGVENKYYRLSSSVFNVEANKPSFVYLRFKDGDEYFDYIDCRGNLSEDEYNTNILLNEKIPYQSICNAFKRKKNVKLFSKNVKDNAEKFFNSNVLTYFPSYRYEVPGYLNTSFKPVFGFSKEMSFSNTLENPIEVTTGLDKLSDWILDVVLDQEVNKQTRRLSIEGLGLMDVITGYGPELQLWTNMCHILQRALYGKGYKNRVRFGVGPRYDAGKRIAIMEDDGNGTIQQLCPNLIYLSSGETAIISMFGEVLRQGDNIKPNCALSSIEGIVMIDEVDKHLHIKLQKEVLPLLFELFPNIQFIVTSHSPFMNMGLFENESTRLRERLIDLDNNGLMYPIELYDNASYKEVYNMLVSDNIKYAHKYNELKEQIEKCTKPLVITEGKTDSIHIKAALSRLGLDLDVDYYPVGDDWGDTKLQEFLSELGRTAHQRKIIGIFDRDDDKERFLKFTDTSNMRYKQIGIPQSNVYAFCIPLVNEDTYGNMISIEHYYKEKDLTKEDAGSHRRVFLGKEFNRNSISKNKMFITKIKQIDHKISNNGVITEKVYYADDENLLRDIALSKIAFAQLMAGDNDFSKDVDFSCFKAIYDILKEIVDKI